jgi:hypothetical protein
MFGQVGNGAPFSCFILAIAYLERLAHFFVTFGVFLE